MNADYLTYRRVDISQERRERGFAPRAAAIFAISSSLLLLINTGVAHVRSWPAEDINGPLGAFHDRGRPISIWINGDTIISKGPRLSHSLRLRLLAAIAAL